MFNGPGTLVLSGNNSESGETAVSSDSLSIDDGGTNTCTGGTIVNQGTRITPMPAPCPRARA